MSMDALMNRFAPLSTAEQAFKKDYPHGHQVAPFRSVSCEERKILEDARYAKYEERLVRK
jgi:hypothetical protein